MSTNKAVTIPILAIFILAIASIVWAKTTDPTKPVKPKQITQLENTVQLLEDLQHQTQANEQNVRLILAKIEKLRLATPPSATNPFVCPPPIQQKQPEPIKDLPPTQKTTWPKLTLDGIMRSGNTALALINGRLFKINDTINTVTITDITKSDVRLKAPDGTTKTLIVRPNRSP